MFMNDKKLPVGYENFKSLIDNNLYYVDKTMIIEELIENKNYITLFPRPRRFGKTLFMSMLDNFFNIEYKDSNKNLFNNLKISDTDKMESDAREALEQIEDKAYYKELEHDKVKTIYKYAIVFGKNKTCIVR